ncbi:acid sugar phosphatase [Rhizocola hellebori]|uniref:Acid sugar phosphatase n=1 Tax=Rhizocola hellebori TaxID=1392758 RepID=A0A8J3VLQ5_9ACTN|nr:acid sugar phosphatase [Rhizocola hellebori]
MDLDGVVVLGDRPVDGAPEALRRLREMGKTIRFVTNNASRRRDEVAALLTGIGVAAEPGEVLTSAAAAAQVLAERFAPGSRVLVVGAPALADEVTAAGLTVVTKADDDPVAVVQGYGPKVGWEHLAEACVAVRGGAQWIATNTDKTLPTPRGPLPGNGALVAALATALERQPDLVVGKPEPALFLAAARDAGAAGTLIVGDRLDTDIMGANRAAMDSLLVLTGVATAEAAQGATGTQRPTFVAKDLSGLFAVA